MQYGRTQRIHPMLATKWGLARMGLRVGKKQKHAATVVHASGIQKLYLIPLARFDRRRRSVAKLFENDSHSPFTIT